VADRLVQLRPDFAIVEIEGGTSYVIRDEPETWVGVIIDFIRG